MTLGIRKLLVAGLLGGVLLVANIMMVAYWLDEMGVVEGAAHLCDEYITGTAIAIIVVLLVLLVNPTRERVRRLHRCPVCDHAMLGRGKYCSECGSRAT